MVVPALPDHARPTNILGRISNRLHNGGTIKSLPAFLLLAGSMALHANGGAAPVQAALPPPGLYQIDIDASDVRADGKLTHQAKTNGATGAEHHQFTVPGGTAGVNAAGTGPATQCIKPYTDDASTIAIADMALAQCPKQSHKVINDKTVEHTAQCPSGNVTVTFRKIGSKTWQMESRHETFAVQGQAAYDALRPMMELQASHGKTAAERAQATQQLAALPALKVQANEERQNDIAQLKAALQETNDPAMKALFQKEIANLSQQGPQPGKVVQTALVKMRLTRIADSCNAPNIPIKSH